MKRPRSRTPPLQPSAKLPRFLSPPLPLPPSSQSASVPLPPSSQSPLLPLLPPPQSPPFSISSWSDSPPSPPPPPPPPTPIAEDMERNLIMVCFYSQYEYSYTLHCIPVGDLLVAVPSAPPPPCWNRRRRNHRHRKLSVKCNVVEALPKPFLKLSSETYPPLMGFMAVGPKIYFFGGLVEGIKKEQRVPCDCYVYDTSNPSNGVQKGPLMNFGKSQPKIVGPICGKYYVLSYTLAACDFELFNTHDESWTALPSPPACEGLEYKDWSDFAVCDCAVIHNKIFLATSFKGIFCFDLDTRKWRHQTSFFSSDRLPFMNRADFADGLWFGFPDPAQSPLYSYILDSRKGLRRLRVRGLKHPSKLVKNESTNDLVPLQNQWFVVLRSGFPKHYRAFYVTFDLFQLTRSLRDGKLSHPRVSNQYYSKYFLKNYIEHDVTISTCFAM